MRPGTNRLFEALFQARRWSRSWKVSAKDKWPTIRFLRNTLDDATDELKETHARVQALEKALQKARPLLQDTVDAHRDPSDAEYNECDTAPCDWCVAAREIGEVK